MTIPSKKAGLLPALLPALLALLLTVILATCLAFTVSAAAAADVSLPVGTHPPALVFSHFPDRAHALVWRNWQLVDPERLAGVLGTTAANVHAMASSMGLPPARTLPDELKQRAYITVVRRNWHLLPYDQLLQLLDMTAGQLDFALKEDDFLFIKLGSLKPMCEPLRYEAPDEATRRRVTEVKRTVERHFGTQLAEPGEDRFEFIRELSTADADGPTRAADPARIQRGLRMLYSYVAPFGDPLTDRHADPFPDGLLSRLADAGVNGVWLHALLRQLAPGGEHFPEFGEGHATRLENLGRLVQRARRHGIGVYLYMNEPRAMPPAFFQQRPEMAGITAHGQVTMCTSDPRVHQWMADALSHVFRNVPDLAGVFTITASENPTNCSYSRRHAECERCRQRSHAEIIAEVNTTIEQGVHAAAPQARVIVWDWGYNGHGDATDIIERLPKSIWLMSVSEWAQPVERGGVRTQVGEYSLSVVGPGPRARKHWAFARQRGMRTVAKMQINNTWEMAAVPAVPVLDLVARHCANLARESVDGQMLSWTLGGYPSPNLEVAQRFAESPTASPDDVLDEIAVARYGPSAAPLVRQAWTAFSDAFGQFPYHGAVVYNGPHLSGPANLLFARPTGYAATMVGFPYDDVNGWRGPYPPAVLGAQYRQVAARWAEGLDAMQQAVARTPEPMRGRAARDLGLARTCQLHFASAANQVDFVLARDALQAEGVTDDERDMRRAELKRIAADEISIARQMYVLAKADSRIGFEATNHYFYVPLDLVEKVLNCESILRSLGNPHGADIPPQIQGDHRF